MEKNSVKEIEKNRKKKKREKMFATSQISIFLHLYGKLIERTHLHTLSTIIHKRNPANNFCVLGLNTSNNLSGNQWKFSQKDLEKTCPVGLCDSR